MKISTHLCQTNKQAIQQKTRPSMEQCIASNGYLQQRRDLPFSKTAFANFILSCWMKTAGCCCSAETTQKGKDQSLKISLQRLKYHHYNEIAAEKKWLLMGLSKDNPKRPSLQDVEYK